MGKKSLWVAIILFALTAFAQVRSDSDQLLDLDRGFARGLLTDRDKVASYTDTTSFVVVGSQNLHDFFEGREPSGRLTLSPQEAKIVSLNRLGYTSGAFDYTYAFAKCNCSVAEHGTYMTIWKREKRGWKIIAFIPSVEQHFGCGCSG